MATSGQLLTGRVLWLCCLCPHAAGGRAPIRPSDHLSATESGAISKQLTSAFLRNDINGPASHFALSKRTLDRP